MLSCPCFHIASMPCVVFLPAPFRLCAVRCVFPTAGAWFLGLFVFRCSQSCFRCCGSILCRTRQGLRLLVSRCPSCSSLSPSTVPLGPPGPHLRARYPVLRVYISRSFLKLATFLPVQRVPRLLAPRPRSILMVLTVCALRRPRPPAPSPGVRALAIRTLVPSPLAYIFIYCRAERSAPTEPRPAWAGEATWDRTHPDYVLGKDTPTPIGKGHTRLVATPTARAGSAAVR